MNWDNIIQKVSPYLVKIETPTGSGSGFLCAYNEAKTFCGVATACHVVADTEEWQQPMRIYSHDFQHSTFLKEIDRVIFTDYKTDSAVILFAPGDLHFPQELIPLRPIESPLNIGVEVGWLGYPALEPYTLCFFSGNVSARRENRSAYLIDGVAINGVSGGPVIFSSQMDDTQFVGVVSAYRANRQRGDALPGLSVAQDVSHFHEVIHRIKSRDEALKKRTQLEAEKQKEPEKIPQQKVEPNDGSTMQVENPKVSGWGRHW
jgi:hypothetical protein